MKSVKPGRGPSMMGGIVAIMMAVFGVVFLVVLINTSNSFGPYFGGGFGSSPETLGIVFCVIFIIVAVIVAVYNIANATKKNRYSVLDITDGTEEPDPLNEKFSGEGFKDQTKGNGNSFCPYCGSKVQGDFEFCNACGKKLPE
ncbi:MAG: zinc-ribbon domain-containing protein [Burkholderiales bacterium]